MTLDGAPVLGPGHLRVRTSMTTRDVLIDGADRILRLRYVVLGALFAAGLVVAGGRGDWATFVAGARDLTSADGLSVFARRGDLQTGPVHLLVVRSLAVTPRDGFVACSLLAGALGLLAVWLTERQARSLGADPARVRLVALLGGAVLAYSWTKLGGYGHLDDAITLVLLLAAVALLLEQRWLVAAVCLGVALATKPWAVMFLPVLLAAPTNRSRVRAVVVAGGVGALLWGPFFLAAPETMRSLRPTVALSDGSFLRLLGISEDLPSALRPVQLSLGAALAGLAVARGRLPAAVLAAVCVRVALDPGTWSYYSAGVVVAALLVDLVDGSGVVPVLTLVVTALLVPAWILPDDTARMVLRGSVAVVGAAAAWGPLERRAGARRPQEPSGAVVDVAEASTRRISPSMSDQAASLS